MRHIKHSSRHVMILATCLLALPFSCNRSSTPTDLDGPTRLFQDLRTVHQERRYKDLDTMVEPKQLATLVRTLMAVDRLLTVSQQLQEAAEAHVGPTAAEVCNMSVLGDYLGPFSRHAQIVSTQIENSNACVIYQVGERVPVERAQMRLEYGRWVYVPDEADEKLPDLLRELTNQLVSLKGEAERGTYRERAFMEEYARRVQAPLAAHLAEVEQASKKKAHQAN